MHNLTIKTIERQHSIPDAEDFLEVAFSIDLDGEEVYSGLHGFPLTSTKEEIQDSMKRFLDTFVADAERSVTNQAVEAIHEQADEVIASLTGSQIS